MVATLDAVDAIDRDWGPHHAELVDRGFTVLPRMLDATLTARVRAHMDAVLPPLTDAGHRVSKVHPIPGSVMAELAGLPTLLSAAQEFYRCPAIELRMSEQVLIRTDPHPTAASGGAHGWHVRSPTRPTVSVWSRFPPG